MSIVYPYNEILPKNRAHDTYLVHQCRAFAERGIKTTLLCGRDSLAGKSFYEHYGISQHLNFQIEQLPIVRKNNLFNLSWNLPFFFSAQKKIESTRPQFVFLSVLKQGVYHLRRKVKGVKYIYEVHELAYYPNNTCASHFTLEKEMLTKADLITVTTHQLYEILRKPPYSLKNPIEIVPLAVKQPPLPEHTPNVPLHITYVGQLYQGQGIDILLEALSQVDHVKLTIIGGKPHELANFQEKTKGLGITGRVEFLGFQPPALLSKLVEKTDAFVAPFENIHRMAYVSHTKLFEYAEWGRPMIVPDLPIVREHFSEERGAILFKAGDPISLAEGIRKLQRREELQNLQKKISSFSGQFTWEKRMQNYTTLLKYHEMF